MSGAPVIAFATGEYAAGLNVPTTPVAVPATPQRAEATQGSPGGADIFNQSKFPDAQGLWAGTPLTQTQIEETPKRVTSIPSTPQTAPSQAAQRGQGVAGTPLAPEMPPPPAPTGPEPKDALYWKLLGWCVCVCVRDLLFYCACHV